MPFANEHAARITDPDKYIRIRRKNDEFGKGIHVYYGVLKDGKTEVQSIHFDADKFSPTEARDWLKDHDYKPIEFAPATGKANDISKENKETNVCKEYKIVNFKILGSEEKTIDNTKYGIIKGYAATYGNVDRGNDMIMQGAFDECLKRYREEDRQIKMHYQHNMLDIIGGFPIDKIKSDSNGLYVEGQINLDVQKGAEAYALAKQGVICDMSIGYSVDDAEIGDKNVRKLKALQLWEISLVGEPMNPKATIDSVKSNTSFQDLPLADDGTKWDASSAIARIRKFTDSEDSPSAKYKNAFMWFDESNSDNFTAYKLPYVDVIDGKLKAVPRAIYAIAAVLKGGRGGVDIPSDDKSKVVSHVNKYYAKMGKDSPLKSLTQPEVITINDIWWVQSKSDVENILSLMDITTDNLTRKDFERKLRNAGVSRESASFLVSTYKNQTQSDSVDDEQGHPAESNKSETIEILTKIVSLLIKIEKML